MKGKMTGFGSLGQRGTARGGMPSQAQIFSDAFAVSAANDGYNPGLQRKYEEAGSPALVAPSRFAQIANEQAGNPVQAGAIGIQWPGGGDWAMGGNGPIPEYNYTPAPQMAAPGPVQQPMSQGVETNPGQPQVSSPFPTAQTAFAPQSSQLDFGGMAANQFGGQQAMQGQGMGRLMNALRFRPMGS